MLKIKKIITGCIIAAFFGGQTAVVSADHFTDLLLDYENSYSQTQEVLTSIKLMIAKSEKHSFFKKRLEAGLREIKQKITQIEENILPVTKFREEIEQIHQESSLEANQKFTLYKQQLTSLKEQQKQMISCQSQLTQQIKTVYELLLNKVKQKQASLEYLRDFSQKPSVAKDNARQKLERTVLSLKKKIQNLNREEQLQEQKKSILLQEEVALNQQISEFRAELAKQEKISKTEEAGHQELRQRQERLQQELTQCLAQKDNLKSLENQLQQQLAQLETDWSETEATIQEFEKLLPQLNQEQEELAKKLTLQKEAEFSQETLNDRDHQLQKEVEISKIELLKAAVEELSEQLQFNKEQADFSTANLAELSMLQEIEVNLTKQLQKKMSTKQIKEKRSCSWQENLEKLAKERSQLQQVLEAQTTLAQNKRQILQRFYDKNQKSYLVREQGKYLDHIQRQNIQSGIILRMISGAKATNSRIHLNMYGISPQYVENYLMKVKKNLERLDITRGNIEEIAFRLGFSCPGDNSNADLLKQALSAWCTEQKMPIRPGFAPLGELIVIFDPNQLVPLSSRPIRPVNLVTVEEPTKQKLSIIIPESKTDSSQNSGGSEEDDH
jgi:hypothetical protein